MGTVKVWTSAYHPQSYAAAESFNRTMIKFLRAMVGGNTRKWESFIPMLKLSYNTAIQRSTLRFPFMLIRFYSCRLPYFDILEADSKGPWLRQMMRIWEKTHK